MSVPYPDSQSALRPTFSVPILLLLSGAAGLGYQVIWIRLLAVGLGHETVSMLAVVTAFFAGLAIGSWAVDRMSARTPRPDLWYAGLEIAVGLWALLLVVAVPWANALMGDVLGADPGLVRRVAVTFLGPFLLLGPATIAMGAVLPFAERMHVKTAGQDQAVGLLYGCNAFGAAIGGVLALTVIAPAFGFTAVLLAFAGVNALCAVLILVRSTPDGVPQALLHSEMPPRAMRRGALPALLALTGFLGIGVEIALVRGFSQTLENTVYSFAVAVAVYLFGAALGAGWMHRRGVGTPLWALICAVGASTLWSATLLPFSTDIYLALRSIGLTGSLAEAAVIALVFLPAATAMGSLFSSLAQAARRDDGGLGAGMAVNLAGGAVAPWFIGFCAVPLFGTVGSVVVLGCAYLVLALAVAPLRRQAALLAACIVSVSAMLVLQWVPLALVRPLPDEEIVRHIEAPSSTATVLRGPGGAQRLVVDGRFAMGGDSTEDMDRLQGHLPLLLHPAPKTALFLGLGSGATAAAAAVHPMLQSEAIELSQAVLTALPAFAGPSRDLSGTAFILRHGDARRYVRTSERRYDVIVADTFHPARDGAALLYSVEHFESVRSHLAPGGVFAQWLPLHQFDTPMLRIVIASFLKVYPDAQLHIANASLATPLVMLVGREDGQLPSVDDLFGRVRDAGLRQEVNRLGIDSPLAILGGFVAGPEALRRLAGLAPLNRDAFPHLMFAAPSSVYAPMSPPMDRLLSLLDMERQPGQAAELKLMPAHAEYAQRLAQYWQARDAFIRLGTTLSLTGDRRRDALILAPELLRMLSISPDYTPALRPLISLGVSLAAVDPAAARALLLDAGRLTGHPAAERALADLPEMQ